MGGLDPFGSPSFHVCSLLVSASESKPLVLSLAPGAQWWTLGRFSSVIAYMTGAVPWPLLRHAEAPSPASLRACTPHGGAAIDVDSMTV